MHGDLRNMPVKVRLIPLLLPHHSFRYVSRRAQLDSLPLNCQPFQALNALIKPTHTVLVLAGIQLNFLPSGWYSAVFWI